MASEINLSGLTLEPQEVTEVSQAVFEETYAKPVLADAHDVRTGIQMKTQIPLFGQLGILGKKSSGCTPSTGGVISTTEKYWDPQLIDFRLTHCQGDLDQLFKLWKRSRIALNTWEDVDSAMMAFIADRAIEATTETILRISSFGDKTGKLVADGGVITAGTDITYFTMLEGLWKQIFTAVTAGDLTAVYTIAENSEASYVAQLALASDRALNVLRELYTKIDPRVFAINGLVFEMTRSLFSNWQDYMETQSINFTLDRTEAGSTKWTYRGIPIVVRDDWDRNIRTYQDNGTTYSYPHRALLAPIGNIPIGTSDTESFNKMDSFYDKVTKSHYVDMAFYLDVKEVEEYAIAVAF